MTPPAETLATGAADALRQRAIGAAQRIAARARSSIENTPAAAWLRSCTGWGGGFDGPAM